MPETSIHPDVHQAPDKVWNKTFISIMFANFMMYLGHWTIYTLIGMYADHLGATATIVGLVTSLFALTALVFKVISAPAIDTYNRKYILIGAMCVMALAYSGYGISNSVPVLMSFRLLQGAGQAFTATCFLALASDALPPKQMGTGIGYFALAQALCQAIGPTIGLFLVNKIGYNAVFFIASATMLIAVIITSQIKIGYVKTKKFQITLKNVIAKEAILPSLIIFLIALPSMAITSFLVLYAGKIQIANIGYYFTVNAVAIILSRPVIGKLTDKYGLAIAILPGIIFMAVGFFLISIAHSLPLILIAAFLGAIGSGGTQPAIQAVCMRSVSQDRRGAASSTSYIGSDLGNLVGGPLAGILVQFMGYVNMWRIIVVPLVITFAIVIFFRKELKDAELGKNTGSDLNGGFTKLKRI